MQQTYQKHLKESEKEAKIVISDPGAQAIANNALYESKIIRILSKDRVTWRYFVNVHSKT